MNETMTLEALERAMERVRAQMRRVVASLRDPLANAPRRPRAGEVTPTMRLENLDWELERLRVRKRRIEAWLRDPDESARRRARRASVFARWVEPTPARMGPMRALGLERWVETLEVAPAQMRSIRALADGADRALLADEALAADGWRRDADGHWHGALTAAACEGPVTDVVVLAQARADVDRTLAPTPEETLAPGEWTSVLGEDAPRGDGPPPPDLGTCTGPTAEALDAASARFAELCEAWTDARQPDGTFVTAAGEVVDPYAERVQARARALVAERVAAAMEAMEAAGRKR